MTLRRLNSPIVSPIFEQITQENIKNAKDITAASRRVVEEAKKLAEEARNLLDRTRGKTRSSRRKTPK
jgi:hypothetical protein